MTGAATVEFLLVQDDPAEELYTREMLETHKVLNRVHTVHTVPQALAFLRRDPPYAHAPAPDVILLDLNLPGRDGRHLLRHLGGSAPAVAPVVLLVDSPVAERILRREGLPVQGYASKPVDLACLTSVVRSLDSLAFVVLRLD
ncbi:response regulator [Amorphoplanes nipponensis]|uniref:Two-component system response regulator n=1 Tax=Actinoplanes nipponensis TaxID=135950 RepID=A0A919JDK2_9ACTN|nr:response regulator [Actinoplanes nipponensis]GIE47221.1 two-component system response regulator [Actinoplanes nipponensis]